MPFKDLRKSRVYSRIYMRQLRATLRAQRQGATINPEELSQIKLVGVKPKVRCSECGQTIKTNLAEKKVAKEQLEKTQE